MSRLYIKFCGGTSDKKNKSLCSSNGNSIHVRKIFNKMGFNDQEIVCLIGGGWSMG